MSEQPQVANFIPPPEQYPEGKGKCAACEQVKTLQGSFCYNCRGKRQKARILAGGETAHARKLAEQFAAMVAKLNEDNPDVPSISLITSKMIAALGNVDGFVTKWVSAIEHDKTSPKTKLDAFGALAKFCVIAGERNAAMAGLKTMSDAELQDFAMEMLAQEMQGRGLRLVSAEEDGAAPQEGAA